MEHAVYSNIAPVVSLSFGGCESAQGSFNTFISSLWEQAAAQGQTVLVSTGDSGSAGCDDGTQFAVGGQAVNGLASTPYDVAVGGTDFYYSDYATGGASVSNYWNLTPPTIRRPSRSSRLYPSSPGTAASTDITSSTSTAVLERPRLQPEAEGPAPLDSPPRSARPQRMAHTPNPPADRSGR